MLHSLLAVSMGDIMNKNSYMYYMCFEFNQQFINNIIRSGFRINVSLESHN